MTYRCPLGRLQPNDVDTEHLKRKAYQEYGTIVVGLDDRRIDWVEREVLKRVGDRLYGERKGNG